MEIQECSLPGFYCSRLLGLAPYLIKRNKNDRIDKIQRSPWLCIYSICFMTATVGLTVRFLCIDANSKAPIRMRTATSRFVNIFNVCVLVSACLCGAITGVCGYKHTKQINENLKKADDELAMFNDQKRDKRRNFLMVAIVFFSITLMVILDAIAKWRNADQFRESTEDEIDIEDSLPFYILFYILMSLHTQLAQTALGVQKRYQRLNMAISDLFSLKQMSENGPQMDVENIHELLAMEINDGKSFSTANTNVSRAKEVENNTMSIFGTEKHSASLSTKAFGKLIKAKTVETQASTSLEQLSCTHAILGETAMLTSKVFGMTILALLSSCLLHLVATAYFLFNGLLGDPDWFGTLLQLMWCCFHFARLLLIVEPCDMAAAEARKTMVLISEVLRNEKDSLILPNLRRFWRQLLADDTYYFTAHGVCTIDRQILTTIGGAVILYLVILIQFQKSDG